MGIGGDEFQKNSGVGGQSAASRWQLGLIGIIFS